MRLALCLLTLLSTTARADESADRAAIVKAVSRLNEVPRRASLFTADADGFGILDRLQNVPSRSLRIVRFGELVPGTPGVTISKEPWGEATLNAPALPTGAIAELANPSISAGTIRFVTVDVALVDVSNTYWKGLTTETTPLLAVVKREGTDWKIASLRALAEPPR